MRRDTLIGWAALLLSIGFNIPYAILAATFDYPDVLRRDAGEVLARFAQGGEALVLTWYAFALTALGLLPMALSRALTRRRIGATPALAIAAAVSGALAALTQAVGLLRWVFVVPGLAQTHADPLATADAVAASERTFSLLNAYGGVAIGEHLGQLLMALFVALVAAMQWGERARVVAVLGFAAAVAIAAGTGEGLMLALGRPAALFSLFTITGFLGLALWLAATGVALIRTPSPALQGALS